VKESKIFLTEKQARLLLRCTIFGYDHLQQFLRHDDWDCELNKKEKHNSMKSDREFLKAYKMLLRKLNSKKEK
jgi:hypothetical protein